MSPPVGPTGCSATPVEVRRPYTLGLSYGTSDTRLIFTNETRVRFRQAAYSLSFVAALKSELVLGVALGPHMGGRIEGLRGTQERWEIRPGVVWSLSVARRFFGTEPRIPYLLVIGTFSGSSASTRRLSDGARAGLHALDIKADVSVGWTLGGSFSPYLAVRSFAGPAFWRQGDEAVIGTDLYHLSVACGFSLVIANRVSAWFDGAFLGLQGLGGGLGVRF